MNESALQRAKKALPRSSAGQLVKIIKSYTVASNGGESPVNCKDVASVAGMDPSTVSGNNSFLEESLVLISPKYGYYLPTEGAVRFAREAAWGEDGAKKNLRSVVSESWYGQMVIQIFVLRPFLSRDEFQMSLAIRCGATEGDAEALGFLIDFILYSNLAVSDDSDVIRRGNFDEPANKPENVSRLDQTASVQAAAMQAKVSPVTADRSKRVSLVCHVHIRDFSELTATNALALREWIRLLNNESVEFEITSQEGPSEGSSG